MKTYAKKRIDIMVEAPLMQRVLAIASRRHFEVATLAVDAANVPAVRLYRRAGYVSVAQRVAMVKRL